VYTCIACILPALLQYRSEINLGVDATGFTVVKYYRPLPEQIDFIRVCLSLSQVSGLGFVTLGPF